MGSRASHVSLLFAAIGAASLNPRSSSALSPPSSSSAQTSSCPFPGSQPTTDQDRAAFRRQTGQTAPAEAAIGVPSTCFCRHGFPQAFAMDPIPSGGRRINSGLVKLSCPHLVRAVDELEDEGGIGMMNDMVGKSDELQQSVTLAHELYAKIRREMVHGVDNEIGGAVEDILRRKLGERGAEAFLSSGVAGASAGSTEDVKCLHAWFGDYLFRGPALVGTEDGCSDVDASVAMGYAVAQALVDRGVDVSGTDGCQSLCDPSSNSQPLPPRPRNKQRLKTGKEIARRKRRTEEARREGE